MADGFLPGAIMRKIKENNLYLVITEEYCKGRSAAYVAREAIAGGVDIVQMREKNKPRGELLSKGRELLSVCRASGIPLIINDDPELACDIGADGVHLGQEDLAKCPIEAVRDILGADKIVGVSTHSLDQFRQAHSMDVDYLAYGPIFPTRTKDYCIGTSGMNEAARSAKKPVFFIGGIDLSNVSAALASGAGRIALIRAIAASDDVRAAAALFKEALSRPQMKGNTMTIRINGKTASPGAASNIDELIRTRMLSPDKIVIEHNRRVVPKEEWARTALNDGDALEIISFVGGG